MNNCLTSLELKELGDSSISAFDKRIAAISAELCGPLHQEARQLETELLTIYRIIVLAVRKEENMKAVADAWGALVAMCDNAARSLRQLTTKHPACGADYYCDRVLDLRSKCNRLQQMHS